MTAWGAESWKRMSGKVGGRRCWRWKVRRKCQKNKAALAAGRVAVQAGRRGEGSGMDDSLKWMTDVVCCSSSCQQNQRQRKRRKRRDIGQSVRPEAGDRWRCGPHIHRQLPVMYLWVIKDLLIFSVKWQLVRFSWPVTLQRHYLGGEFDLVHFRLSVLPRPHNTTMRNRTAVELSSLTLFLLLWERIPSARFDVLME